MVYIRMKWRRLHTNAWTVVRVSRYKPALSTTTWVRGFSVKGERGYSLGVRG